MSYQLADFVDQVEQAVRTDKWYSGDRAAELNAIAALLATDPTTKDSTLQKPPVGLRPGNRGNTPFANKVLAVVNRGKGGNLLPLDMGNAITARLSDFFPPVNTALPVVTGTTTLTTTNGNWTYVPTSYAYIWLRGGVPITGATGQSYTVVAADSGTNITCRVTASNAAGSTSAMSNPIAVP
jgi:hypothetical protein